MFTWPVRVYYEDTDLGGVVYYANYLRFMERARTEWLRHLGVDQTRLLEDRGLIFVIVSTEVRYLRPAQFNDLLHVTVQLEGAQRATMEFAQEIRRNSPEGDLLTRGQVKAACVAAESFRPRAIPPDIIERLEQAG
jgi:acyl-CoA thioester hydrolase